MEAVSTAAGAAALLEALRADLEAADARILENPDGTLIVRLVETIKIGDTEHTRLTVRRTRLRDVQAARNAAVPMEAYAAELVEPAGAFGELLTDLDYTAVIRATERSVGKFREAGRASSRS